MSIYRESIMQRSSYVRPICWQYAYKNSKWCKVKQSVASLGGGEGEGGPPRVTPSRGVTPEGKKFVGQIYKE